MRIGTMHQRPFPRGIVTLLLIVVGVPLVLTGLLPLQIIGGAMILLSLFTPSLGKSPRAESAQTGDVGDRKSTAEEDARPGDKGRINWNESQRQ